MIQKKPSAVIIGDIHFTLATLEVASACLLKAMSYAKQLEVPLIINGDTLDSKAIIRAEIANTLLRLLCHKDKTDTYLVVGNHDLCNEKGDEHSLNFLFGFAHIVDKPQYVRLGSKRALLVPYQSKAEDMQRILSSCVEPEIEEYDSKPCKTYPYMPHFLIVHQGVQTAFLGHYAQDKTSLPPEAFDGFRVIGSHYHRRQDIQCGKTGLFSYIGNPYTLTFGEAEDDPKGFSVLYDDGSLEFIPTKQRKHVVVERPYDGNILVQNVQPNDLVWLKISGPHSELIKRTKSEWAKLFAVRPEQCKLDFMPNDTRITESVQTKPPSESEQLDALIDTMGEKDTQKTFLKNKWRTLISEN